LSYSHILSDFIVKSLQAVHRYLQAAWASAGFTYESADFAKASVGFGLGICRL